MGTRRALFDLQLALHGEHFMAGSLAVAPEAQVHARFAHTELVQRNFREPMRQHGIDIEFFPVGSPWSEACVMEPSSSETRKV